MKRLAVTAVLLLLCISFPNSLEARDKAPSVDMSKMNRIFLGGGSMWTLITLRS